VLKKRKRYSSRSMPTSIVLSVEAGAGAAVTELAAADVGEVETGEVVRTGLPPPHSV
jgi:hypothetical protein